MRPGFQREDRGFWLLRRLHPNGRSLFPKPQHRGREASLLGPSYFAPACGQLSPRVLTPAVRLEGRAEVPRRRYDARRVRGDAQRFAALADSSAWCRAGSAGVSPCARPGVSQSGDVSAALTQQEGRQPTDLLNARRRIHLSGPAFLLDQARVDQCGEMVLQGGWRNLGHLLKLRDVQTLGPGPQHRAIYSQPRQAAQCRQHERCLFIDQRGFGSSSFHLISSQL
jgi:hypothetical protein